jgi:hypothetical protein
MVLIAVVDAQMKCKKKSETQASEKRRWRKPKLPAAESK